MEMVVKVVTRPLNRLEQSSLGTGDSTFEIDRLRPVRPVSDRDWVGLGCLLVRT